MPPLVSQVRYSTSDGSAVGSIGDTSSRRGATRPVDVTVHDARRAPATLDRNGFTMVRLDSAVRDWEDREEVKKVFYREAAELVRRTTGASRAAAFTHFVRTEQKKDFLHAYSRFAHSDLTDGVGKSDSPGLMVSRVGLSPAEAEGMDWCYFGLWMPIERPVEQNPLVLLDCTTVADADVVRVRFPASGKFASKSSNEICQIREGTPGRHRWCYYPNMKPGEAVLFKHLDGRVAGGHATGVAKQCFHSSVKDPAAPPTALGRRSAEVRVLACFPKPAGARL